MNEIIRMTVRLPQELYQKLSEMAKDNQRSVHGQILFILWEYARKAARPEGER